MTYQMWVKENLSPPMDSSGMATRKRKSPGSSELLAKYVKTKIKIVNSPYITLVGPSKSTPPRGRPKVS